MDYETKIYLDKLVEAVDKLDSPDWWVIGLTIINTLAVITIAVVQILMQRQQMRIQKHETYKDIYKLLQAIHSRTDNLLHNITLTLSVKHYDDFSIEYLTRRKIELSELITKFTDSEDEIRLKIGITHLQHIYYHMLLISAHDVVDTVLHNINYKEFTPHKIEDGIILTDDKCIAMLIDKVAKEKTTTSKGVLDYFVKTKSSVAEHSLLDAIEKHCK